MATILIEGFDRYGPANTLEQLTTSLLNQGGWSPLNPINNSTQYFIVPGLAGFGGGAMQMGPTVSPGNNGLSKTLPNNFSRLIGGVRFRTDNNGYVGIMFYDSNTVQCFIRIDQTSGRISLYQGNWNFSSLTTATLLASSVASVPANTAHVIEWDISFGLSASATIWLDGVQIIFVVGQTIQSVNSYANVVQFFNQGSGGGGIYIGSVCAFDDLYLFDQTTSFNNAVLLSNPIIFTDFPLADHQKQFTNGGNVVGNYFNVSGYSNNPFNFDGNITLGANQLYLMSVTPSVACTINSITVAVAHVGGSNASANFRGVIYSDSSGTPNSLMSSGTQVTGYTIGVPITLPLTSPQALSAGTQYWIGLINDSSVNLSLYAVENPALNDMTSTLFNGKVAGNTYASGAPSTAPAMTQQSSIGIFGNCTGSAVNWASESVNPAIGNASSVNASVASTEDLYQFPGLNSVVGTVYTVGVNGNCYLSGPGTKQIDFDALSSGTDGNGSVTNISITLARTWYSSYFDTDPHTGAAWAVSAVNNGFYGMKVVA